MPSLYTFTQKPAQSETSGSKDINGMGSQPLDGGRLAIQHGNGFQTTDASSTAVKSPVTLSSTVTTLETPISAITLELINTGADALNYSEVSSMASYATLPAGDSVTLDVGNCLYTYLSSTTGTTCSFVYTIV